MNKIHDIQSHKVIKSIITVCLIIVLIVANNRAFAVNGSRLTSLAKEQILAAHNAVRQNVNNGIAPISGEPVQPAANPPLPPMVWSNELENAARAHAERCIWAHSSNIGLTIGENLYYHSRRYAFVDPTVPIQSWVSEASDYNYVDNTCSAGQTGCGHYTQIVWHDSVEIGCAAAICPSGVSPLPRGQIWVCNYSPAGNINPSVNRPYLSVAGDAPDDNTWTKWPGFASDIDIGTNGSVYVIGSWTTTSPSVFAVWNESSGAWDYGPEGTRVAAGTDGSPRAILSYGTFEDVVFKRQGTDWTPLSSKSARDIGVGADGTAWMITNEVFSPGDYKIARWNGSSESWIDASGAAVRIAVTADGIPWVVNDAGHIYRANDAQGSAWTRLPGLASDIEISPDGVVWVIGVPNNDLYSWDGSTWQPGPQLPGTGVAVAVAVDPSGKLWVVDDSKAIYTSDFVPASDL